MKNIPNHAVVDLFCGVGGLTHGLKQAGLNVVAGLDCDNDCRYAYEVNNKGAKFLNQDVANLTGSDLERLYPSDSVKILVGCAPCQPFSLYSSRYRKEGHKDNKWKLLYSFANLVEAIQPQVVSMENVPGLQKESVFTDFVNILEQNGYYVVYRVVFCPDYGAPQNRRRLVLLASRFGEIAFPEKTHSQGNYVTVRDAIGHFPKIADGETDVTDRLHHSCALSKLNKQRMAQSKPGGTWRDWDEHLRLKCHRASSGKTFPSVYGRMKWDEPSPTITTQFFGYGNGRFGHPEQDRAISIREGASLQTFPDDYKFLSEEQTFNRTKLGIHIGNAVPVVLGKAVGIAIKNYLQEFSNDR